MLLRLRSSSSPRKPIRSRPPSRSPGPPSDSCPGSGRSWPSRSSPAHNRSRSWPASIRSAASSSTSRPTPPSSPWTTPSTPAPKADEVLFHLPVTKAWLRQLVLALVLICHSSYRGVVELLRDLFDCRSPWGPCTTSCQRRRTGSGDQPHVTTWPASASGPTTRSFRPATRCSWASIPPRPIATCSAWRTIATP